MTSKSIGIKKRIVSSRQKSNNVRKSSARQKRVLPTEREFGEFVQKRAYYIWQESGKPQGKDWDIWLKAEHDIRSEFNLQ